MTKPPFEPLEYAVSATVVAKKRLPLVTRCVIGLLFAIGLLCLLIFARTPYDREAYNAQHDLAEVCILRPQYVTAVGWLMLPGFVLPLIAGSILVVRQRYLLGSLAIVLTLAISLMSLVSGVTRNLGPWTVCDQVTLPDGTQYSFLDSSFLQGQVMAIARPKSSSTFHDTYTILGSTNGDSPRSYLRVVRPVPFKAIPYGALYHTSGLIVGLRYDNFCYLAYDIANQRFHGHGDVEMLSPFLLLNEKSQLHAPDEASILKAITGGEAMGLPTRETLTTALAHPNAAVRTSAANMLKAMGQ